MSYRVRCGDCACALSRRLVGLLHVDRLVSRHRQESGCPAAGLVVLPVKKGAA